MEYRDSKGDAEGSEKPHEWCSHPLTAMRALYAPETQSSSEDAQSKWTLRTNTFSNSEQGEEKQSWSGDVEERTPELGLRLGILYIRTKPRRDRAEEMWRPPRVQFPPPPYLQTEAPMD